MTNSILGIARHVEDADVGEPGGNLAGQFAAVHSGHNDVGEQKVDSTFMAGYDLQGGGAIFGFEDLVALRLQVLPGEAAEIDLVFDEENGFLPTFGMREAESVVRGGGLTTGVDTGEIGAEGSATVRLAVDEDEAAALFHDAVHGGEAEAGALGALGGEERFEDARLGVAVHPDSGVADGEHDIVAGTERGVGRGRSSRPA